MNRYPLWVNIFVIVVMVCGLVLALPNLFGEAPAVQVAPVRPDIKLDEATKSKINELLQAANIRPLAQQEEGRGMVIRLENPDQQIHARDVLQEGLNKDATTASGNQLRFNATLNLMPLTPSWLRALGAKPMYLGLDLRGGVHFLLEVDLAAAIKKRLEAFAADARTQMRNKRIRYSDVNIASRSVELKFSSEEERSKSQSLLSTNNDFLWETRGGAGEWLLTATYTQPAIIRIQEDAVRQNMTTLSHRVNELGVAEPVIQQQGANRIVVQLSGVQDTAKAKEILGRTAILEVRMVDNDPSNLEQALAGRAPPGTELFYEKNNAPVLLKDQVVLTGERLTDAQQGFDQNNQPAVNLTLDGAGARVFQILTRDNVGQRMAILLVEKNRSEVVTAPVIRAEIPGGRIQITGGTMTNEEAHDVALLLRAGALAAPMQIVEERTVGPSLGADNISRGFHSTLWGFAAIAAFMIIYYFLFGFISVAALFCNLVLLIALLSVLQATLTLPGIAAIALTLGMAIDANVLINERIREELRAGITPQAAIHAGYDRAFATILDSNVTTLIAGLALLIFGSGSVRGFAVVHVLGILTSMFSAVVISRALVNAIHGHRRLDGLNIGQVWRPTNLVHTKKVL